MKPNPNPNKSLALTNASKLAPAAAAIDALREQLTAPLAGAALSGAVKDVSLFVEPDAGYGPVLDFIGNATSSPWGSTGRFGRRRRSCMRSITDPPARQRPTDSHVTMLTWQHSPGTPDAIVIATGSEVPIALEGALKLKELSYVHAEGYAAGEMKHGPIALLDASVPVLCLVPDDPWRPKMLSQLQQARTRGAPVIAVAMDGDDEVATLADAVLWVPHVSPLMAPLLTVLPLQQLAYHSALLRGHDVDQPRNLAKSVTVE
jgi:hypothetical protein